MKKIKNKLQLCNKLSSICNSFKRVLLNWLVVFKFLSKKRVLTLNQNKAKKGESLPLFNIFILIVYLFFFFYLIFLGSDKTNV